LLATNLSLIVVAAVGVAVFARRGLRTAPVPEGS
jgi:hypothetical protein